MTRVSTGTSLMSGAIPGRRFKGMERITTSTSSTASAAGTAPAPDPGGAVPQVVLLREADRAVDLVGDPGHRPGCLASGDLGRCDRQLPRRPVVESLRGRLCRHLA